MRVSHPGCERLHATTSEAIACHGLHVFMDGEPVAGGPAMGWYPDGRGSLRLWDGSRWTVLTAA